MSFYEILKLKEVTLGEKVFLKIDDKKITYKRLLKDVNKIKIILEEKKISGRNIGILNEDIYYQLTYFLGALASNNIPVIIHSDINKETYKEIVKENNMSIYGKEHSILIHRENDMHISKSEEINFKATVNLNSGVFGVLSSGTTGVPKIIFRSEESWISSFKYQSTLFNLNKDTVGFINGSLSFTANLNYIIHLIWLGAKVISSNKVMVGSWIKVIKENNVSAIFLVPSKYNLLCKKTNEKLLDVKNILSAGEKLRIDIAKDLKEIFINGEIMEYYGASETSFITYNTYENILKNKESVGYIFPEVNVKIQGDIISVKSKYLANGYFGYYKVNDRGYLKDNILFLKGRNEEIINKSGRKINVNNIKDKISNIDEIEDFRVFSKKDNIHGEEVYLAIILKENINNKGLIINKIKDKLNKFEIPKIIFLNEFPINSRGKVDINALKELV